MKIRCYMPVRDEVDILPHTLRHLHGQGCDVHILDGWSTDGSWEIAVNAKIKDGFVSGLLERNRMSGFPQVTVERFPAAGPSPTQDCAAILRRIEDLAAESDADWILYSDADEWRRVPTKLFTPSGYHAPKEATITEAVEFVTECGYNAIDFRVFQFYCTDDEWAIGDVIPNPSPEYFFRYYDEADCISRIPNRKLWKNVGRVQLAGGGHEVQFPGMRVYPQKFTMKHYPFRTPAQARAKIETRLARRNHQEHAMGWGVHYDQYPPGFDFCWDPMKLKFWKDTRSPLP